MKLLSILKEKNNFKFLVLIVAALFAFLFISKGFSFWLVIVFFLWFLFFQKFNLFLIDKYSFQMISQFFVGLVVISLILLSFGGKKAKNGDNANDFAKYYGKEYEITSAEGNVFGYFKVLPNEYNLLSVDYAIKLVDSEITNNGKCIDKEGSWCSNDPDGTHNGLQETRYHYTAHFPFDSEEGYMLAPTIQPMYCNEQLFETAPFDTSAVDYWCDFTFLAKWKPTDTFLIKSKTTFGSIEELLSIDKIDIYDFSDYFQITYETTDKSGTLTEGPVISNKEIIEQAPFVKSYEVKIQE